MKVITDLRRLTFAAMIFIGLIFGISTGFFAYLQVNGNFHVVERGRVYRSGQLSSIELGRAINSYGLRSVLNLRGASPGEAWYDSEIAVSHTRGLAHYDYGINAEQPATVAQVEDILRTIRNAPKPILVHCKSGSDRTGLVSALYLFSRGESAKNAEKELSLRYGHFPYLVGNTISMDDSFHAYVEHVLGEKKMMTVK